MLKPRLPRHYYTRRNSHDSVDLFAIGCFIGKMQEIPAHYKKLPALDAMARHYINITKPMPRIAVKYAEAFWMITILASLEGFWCIISRKIFLAMGTEMR